MINKYLVWDIEIFNPIPAGAVEWKSYMPLGVSCAATLLSDEPDELILWHSKNLDRPMTSVELDDMIAFMSHCVEDCGYTIVTHNGTSFDWNVVALESNSFAECAYLAMRSIDTMLQFLCIKGYRIGLDAIAKGCGLSGKTEGMNGSLAPELWQSGQYQKVLDYVAQDVRVTLDVVRAVEERKGFKWTSKSGKLNSVSIDQWLTVEQSLRLPLPDTSWMDKPIQREELVKWISI